MAVRSFIAVTALLALGPAAQAADPATPTFPTIEPSTTAFPPLAADPQTPPSVWKGLYIGSDIFFSGGKGEKGLVGGGAFIGYDRHLDNNFVLGIQASTGFAPFSIQHSPFKGYDYAETSAKVGYEMGRFTPYLTAGIALAKPNGAPGAGYLSPADSANNVFSGGSNLSANGVVGAGFDYAVSDKLSVGVAAVVGTGRGFAPPP